MFQTKYLISTYAGKDVGPAVRKILTAFMTDGLQQQYNRSGTNKQKFPEVFEDCIYGMLLCLLDIFICDLVALHGA